MPASVGCQAGAGGHAGEAEEVAPGQAGGAAGAVGGGQADAPDVGDRAGLDQYVVAGADQVVAQRRMLGDLAMLPVETTSNRNRVPGVGVEAADRLAESFGVLGMRGADDVGGGVVVVEKGGACRPSSSARRSGR